MTNELDDFVEKQEEEYKIEDLKKTITRLHKQIDKMRNRYDDLELAVKNAVKDAIADIEIPKITPPKKDKRKKGEEVAVAVLSDWQLGKITSTYNSEIAAGRVAEFAEKVVELTNIQRASHPVKKIHIWALGDIIEGTDIFAGQQWLVDSGLYRQIFKNGATMMADFLRVMLANFEEVHFAGVIGNHGRLGRFGQHHYEDNGDRFLYETVRLILADEKRITWDIPEGRDGDRAWYTVDRIGNYSCMLIHGDQIRGSLGIPFYGVRKKVLGWKAAAMDGQMPDFKDVAFGHWHQLYQQEFNGITVRCSGSTESSNHYALENLAAQGRPTQRLMFVHPEKGWTTVEYPAVRLGTKE
tara:strand:+ start:7575 stop:8636 length:1062 start_codon:yes stop_codon:yes gene_type:complete